MITLEGAMNRFFGQMAEKTARLVGTPWAFVTAVRHHSLGGLRPPVRLFQHLATRRQHGHNHCYVPDRVSHPEHAKPGNPHCSP